MGRMGRKGMKRAKIRKRTDREDGGSTVPGMGWPRAPAHVQWLAGLGVRPVVQHPSPGTHPRTNVIEGGGRRFRSLLKSMGLSGEF